MRYVLCLLLLPLLAACFAESDSPTGETPTGMPQAETPTATVAGNATAPDASSAATSAVQSSFQTATAVIENSHSTATAVVEGSLPAATTMAEAPVPVSEPIPTSAADEFAAQGYQHFERPEVAMMIHPRLTAEATEPPTAEETLYSFVDLNSPYLRLDVDIFYGTGAMSAVSDGFIRDHLTALFEGATYITALEIIDSQETSLHGQPGRIARFNFTSDGVPAYGAILLFSTDDRMYRFLAYGDSYEYPVLEDIIRSIFATAHLRGPA